MSGSAMLKRPCPGCPYTKQPGHIKVTRERAAELATAVRDDRFFFACHETALYDDGDDDDGAAAWSPEMKLCAGALLYTRRVTGGDCVLARLENMIARRDLVGELEGGEQVWGSVAEMIDGAAWERGT